MFPLRDVKLCTHFLSLFTKMGKVAPVNLKQFMRPVNMSRHFFSALSHLLAQMLCFTLLAKLISSSFFHLSFYTTVAGCLSFPPFILSCTNLSLSKGPSTGFFFFLPWNLEGNKISIWRERLSCTG